MFTISCFAFVSCLPLGVYVCAGLSGMARAVLDERGREGGMAPSPKLTKVVKKKKNQIKYKIICNIRQTTAMNKIPQ